MEASGPYHDVSHVVIIVVTLGYCIIMVAGLSGRPQRLTMEASEPHHDVSHVDIIDFDVSHLDIASSWWPASEADHGGQWTPP